MNRNAAAYGCELMIKRSAPTAFNTNDILLLFFTQNAWEQFCRARVKIPDTIIPITTKKYAVLNYGAILVSDKRATSCIIASAFCPKNGRKKNIAILQSSNPNTKSQKCFSFCLVSSSAMVSNSSPDSSSSIVTSKNLAITFKESILGYPLPDSHFETAVRDTYNYSANSSWVSPLFFLNSCSFSPNSTTQPPCNKKTTLYSTKLNR